MSVYFVQAGRYIKVGYSADPIERASTVTVSGRRPADLSKGADARLLGWIPGDRDREHAMHARFGPNWVAGEWFVLDVDDVRELIWSDPRGIDVERMSASAVFAALRQPEATRDEMAAAGICVEAASAEPAIRGLRLGGAA